MNCAECERLISDDLDGVLPGRKKGRLEAHLAVCPGCRSYRERLSRVQVLGRSLEKPGIDPAYFERFSARLESRLRGQRANAGSLSGARLGWRWAWLGVPVFLAVALSLLIFRGGGEAPSLDFFSFETLVARLGQEIGENAELEERFSGLISGAVEEELGLSAAEAGLPFGEDAFFWETLNEEELRLFAEVIQKEIRS